MPLFFFASLYKYQIVFKSILFALLLTGTGLKAQHIDSIYVNLYTDSLKKGTYNYINIDGLLSNGKYIPLDSTHLHFSSSAGKFIGNSLVLAPDCKEEKVDIHVKLKNSNLSKDFTMYIKKKKDDDKLPTKEEILNNMKAGQQKKKKG